jgi:hypothetical protein
MIFANLLEGFVEFVGAGLTPPNVKGGEERSPRSRVLVEKRFHREVGGHLSGHRQKMAENLLRERGELRLSKVHDF